MEIEVRISLLLFSFAAVVLSICLLIGIYHSTQSLTAGDIKPIEQSLQKLADALKQDDAPEGMIATLKTGTAKLQTDLRMVTDSANANPETRKQALDDLNSVVVNLNTLQTQWSRENSSNFSTLNETVSKLSAFRKRLEPTTGLDKVAATVLAGFGKTVVLLGWPLVVLLIFWFLFKSPGAPRRITELVSNFKTLEVAGFKLERADKVRTDFEKDFAQYREEVKTLYDKAVERKGLNKKLAELFGTDSKILAEINKARKSGASNALDLENYRCTIHVPDLLFAETFYQLLEYVPEQQPKKETRGRTWSYRYGFIGRTWRTEKSAVAVVSTKIEDLIDKWGMTRDEASGAQDRKSFLGILIKDNDEAVGLFYMDSKVKNAFGPLSTSEAPPPELCNSILAILGEAKITRELISMQRELSSRAPKIRIYSER